MFIDSIIFEEERMSKASREKRSLRIDWNCKYMLQVNKA